MALEIERQERWLMAAARHYDIELYGSIRNGNAATDNVVA
jgi:hypothetical protein